ncbi:hypothetical protein Shyhy02_63650 [Streptomyces hygroscopicus subsp. hygroscopicus]|nr:hypothetical protein Shyhy02_63650 [Streptomyces hygroscopicus subsp. hygroscopicus]
MASDAPDTAQRGGGRGVPDGIREVGERGHRTLPTGSWVRHADGPWQWRARLTAGRARPGCGRAATLRAAVLRRAGGTGESATEDGPGPGGWPIAAVATRPSAFFPRTNRSAAPSR